MIDRISIAERLGFYFVEQLTMTEHMMPANTCNVHLVFMNTVFSFKNSTLLLKNRRRLCLVMEVLNCKFGFVYWFDIISLQITHSVAFNIIKTLLQILFSVLVIWCGSFYGCFDQYSVGMLAPTLFGSTRNLSNDSPRLNKEPHAYHLQWLEVPTVVRVPLQYRLYTLQNFETN